MTIEVARDEWRKDEVGFLQGLSPWTLTWRFKYIFGASLAKNEDDWAKIAQYDGLLAANLSAYCYGTLQGLAMAGYFLSLCGLDSLSDAEVDGNGGAIAPLFIILATLTALVVVGYRNMHLVRKDAEDAAIAQYKKAYTGIEFYALMFIQVVIGINLSIEHKENKPAEWGARIFAALGALLFAGITSYGNFLMFNDIGNTITQNESEEDLEPWAYVLIGYMSLRLFACEYELLFDPLYKIFNRDGKDSLTSSWNKTADWVEKGKYITCILAPLIAMICMSLVCTEMLANGMKSITIDGEGMGETTSQYLSFSILLSLALAQIPFYLRKANKMFDPKEQSIQGASLSRAINALFNSPSAFLGIIAAVMMFDDRMDGNNPGLMALGVFCAAAACLSSWIANSDVPESSAVAKITYLSTKKEGMSSAPQELSGLYEAQRQSWAPVL